MVNLDHMTPMLTVQEVASLLHVHESTVRRWSDQRIIRGYRITRRGDRRFMQDDIVRIQTEIMEEPSGYPRRGNDAPV